MISMYSLDAAPPLKNDAGLDARLVLDKEDVQVVHFTLQPGQTIEPHSLPLHVCFLVLEGEGEITIERETVRARTGMLVDCPPNLQRSWKAGAGAPLRAVALKIK